MEIKIGTLLRNRFSNKIWRIERYCWPSQVYELVTTSGRLYFSHYGRDKIAEIFMADET